MALSGFAVLWLSGLLAERWALIRGCEAAGIEWTWAHDVCLALLWPAVVAKTLYDLVEKTWLK